MAVQRNHNPNEVRERFLRFYEDPTEDYLMVAAILVVNRSTRPGVSQHSTSVRVEFKSDHEAHATT